MRHSLAFAATAAALFTGLSPAPAALAQSGRMECYGNAGGRATCVTSRDVLFENLDRQARATREMQGREKKLVRAVAQAVHDGRCEEALALALKSDNPMVAANTARLCGVPEAPTPAAGS